MSADPCDCLSVPHKKGATLRRSFRPSELPKAVPKLIIFQVWLLMAENIEATVFQT